MRVLVTGGGGYVGSVLVPLLLEQGFSVTVLDAFRWPQPGLLDCCRYEALEIVRGDCRDEELVARLARSCDLLVPLAAIVGAPACERDAVGAQTVNADAVRLLCRVSAPSQPILLPATHSIYGVGEPGKVCTEDTPLRPISLYGRTKREAEEAVLARGNSVSLRLATAFGASPRMRADLLVNDFVRRAVTDRAIVVFEGRFKRNFIHVRDIARAFIHAVRNFDTLKGRAYNVGLEDANLSKLELCRAIQKIVPAFVFSEAPVGEDADKRDYAVSSARLLGTGFKPEWTLEAGIRELVKAFEILRGRPFADA
ncbi:MAG: NAD(P)-dependent oxidoreductase [Elusimicrobia bacterium]|nr:NAD(P)-dependent oxidoreductase [Elusimicrobiota bacterium]